MFSPRPGLPPKKCASRRILFRCAALVALASGLTILNGCSGFSTPANASSPPASSSDAALSISSTLPSATVGSAYQAVLSVSGGTAPYFFSLASGELPGSVLLNATTGSISGTPTAAGSFSFAISVVDSKGLSKQQSFQLTVSKGGSITLTLTPTTVSVPSGGSTQFSALVSNSSNSAVTWSAPQGSISSNGLYTAPVVTTPTTVTITAASVADPSVSATALVTVTAAASSSNGGNSFSNLQQSPGWGQYGQGPPSFIDCSPSPCDGITYAMTQGIKSPSLSGAASQFDLGGTAVYSDALFNNHLIGAYSSQGMPDNNHTLVPTYHNFTYDVYFYGTNLALSQALEFDINQFFDNLGFIWGHECRIAGGNEWDVWNNVTAHWTPTGVPCYPLDNSWNHLTIKVQRTANNQLLYESITLNGVTNTLNQYYNPGSAVNWYGVTVNYQMDGNYEQAPYTIYLDNLTFAYE
jgi:Putative Ig domain